MYLTITTTHTPATDLGYLLHKRPGKLRTNPPRLNDLAVYQDYIKSNIIIPYGSKPPALFDDLDRLRRSRGLGRKRSLALREFALGVESLEHVVRNEPLRRVQECVFGVLALETEPVDPRL
jgi:hypothetical protein